MNTTRRDFGKIALAGLPALSALLPSRLAAAPNSKFGGVQVGTITYSFKNDVKKPDELIQNMVKIGLSSVELMSDDGERLAGAAAIPNFGFGVKLTPEQQAAVDEGRRQRKEWRRKATPATFENVGKMFADAGIHLDLLCYNMGASIDQEEIDHAFRMARALKVRAISSTSTVAVARRVAPVADKYKIVWGGHNHAAVDDPNEFASLQSFETILGLSKYIGANLDIGHMTAANLDAVAFIQKNHARITNLHLKDRKKNNGPNMVWGQGETPIKEVLQLMKKDKLSFPANIEFEYPIPEGSNSPAEIAKCLAYAKQCLES
ncbi:MAG: sugar phosphate isomerase/epimerase [Bryobacteraceae bacterium]